MSDLPDSEAVVRQAREVMQHEAGAILRMADSLGSAFGQAVARLLQCKGRVVVTGMGKSALIAQKIVATFNSTGTPALFLHAAEAVHGDLGMVQASDQVICLSKSGNTAEIKALVPWLQQQGVLIVAITARQDSYLGRVADLLLATPMESEADPHDLAPTTSTALQLAMGDALAVCLLTARHFGATDFARYHPGGSLGKKLLLSVGDIAGRHGRPLVAPESELETVILEMTRHRLGATAVGREGQVWGIVTDGDLRRMLNQRGRDPSVRAADIMTSEPKTLAANERAVDALALMQQYKVTQLVVVHPDDGSYVGMVHLHDLYLEGL
jgi:arabinose-5-phosphate isomerase